jgi:hypothetical protein
VISARAWLLSQESFQILWKAFAAIMVLSLSCYAPVLPEVVFNIVKRGQGTFQPFFPFAVLHDLAGWPGGLLASALCLVCILGLRALWQGHRQTATYFAWLLCVPLGTVWLARPIYLFPRFFVYFLPYYVLLLSLGFVTLWHFAIRRAPSVYQYSACLLCMLLVGAVLSTWTKHSWYDMEQHGFREAARAMAVESEPEYALCAIGPGAELFQYYSTKPILLPANIGQFADMLENSAGVKCAYIATAHPREPQRDIRDFLVQNAEVQRYARSTVFTYRPKQAKRGAFGDSYVPQVTPL